MRLSIDAIVARFSHLNPDIDVDALKQILTTKPKFFHWSGADLFNVTNARGARQMIVVETNSCPSGQKSTPAVDSNLDENGYKNLCEKTIKARIMEAEAEGKLPEGGLAVVYDKNPMENKGYAAALADAMGEPVWLVEYYHYDENPPVEFRGNVMHVRDEGGKWHPIRAAFRYVFFTS